MNQSEFFTEFFDWSIWISRPYSETWGIWILGYVDIRKNANYVNNWCNSIKWKIWETEIRVNEY